MHANLELVHALTDAWNRRDLDGVLALVADDIEYVNSPLAVEPGTRRGREEYEAVVRAQWDMLGDARMAIESAEVDGDDVYGMLRLSRSLDGSHASVVGQAAVRSTCRDGRVVRMEVLPPERRDVRPR